jgi:hypothetical protein
MNIKDKNGIIIFSLLNFCNFLIILYIYILLCLVKYKNKLLIYEFIVNTFYYFIFERIIKNKLYFFYLLDEFALNFFN